MNRRQLMALMAAVGGGGVIATGTGAFTAQRADRSVSVNVVGDGSAYLRLAPSNGDLSQYINTTSDGEFDINLGVSTGNGGDGINTNAATTFDNLFEVQNQGTQEVEVDISPLAFSTSPGSGPSALTLQVPSSSFPTFTLTPGSTEKITIVAAADKGFNIQPGDEIDDTITITATATP